MGNFNRSRPQWRISSSAALLAAVLVAALGLSQLPHTVTQSLRAGWREALLPTQRTLGAMSDLAAAIWKKTQSPETVAVDQAEQKIAELTDQLQRRELELQLAQSSLAPAPRPAPDDATSCDGADIASPLLISQLIPANVLGQQAKAFLKAHDLLDVGRAQGAAPDALVLDSALGATTGLPSTVLDQGRDTSVQTGRLVLAGSRVWGKVAEVGPHTCTVRRITDSNYRDLVQLATPQNGRLQFSARGVLVGTGQRLCKIELVENTEPVAVGDLVFTIDDGVLPSPLLYGKVVQLDRKPGDAHWQIWVEPAIKTTSPPARVSVLKMELNPARVAETPNH
jgi:cell shape-determining protein MreC